MHAYLLDEALAMRLTVEAIPKRRRGNLPPGMRWATEADYPDDPLDAAWLDSQGATEAAA